MNDERMAVLEKTGDSDTQDMVREVRRLRERIAVYDRDGGQVDTTHRLLCDQLLATEIRAVRAESRLAELRQQIDFSESYHR